MESDSSNNQNKKSTSLPPKRGQVKAHIFESFVNTVVSAVSVVSVVSKVGEKIVGRIRGEGGSGGNSASSTPPPSSYNSDGNSDSSQT